LPLLVLPRFHLFEPAGQHLMGSEQLAQAHERTQNRAMFTAIARLLFKNNRMHRDALLGECIRRVPPAAPTCNLKLSNSSFVSRNRKSSGNRSLFRRTAKLRLPVVT